MDRAEKLNNLVARIFGFTKSGSSLLGKNITKLSTVKNIQRFLTGGMIGLVILFAGFPRLLLATNIGGIPMFNTIPQIRTIPIKTNITVRLPLDKFVLSRGFSWYHSGADMADPVGTPVHPVMDGIVEKAEYGWLGYGNNVIIDHGAGFKSLYGHFSKIRVNNGEKVNVQTVIGEVGSTGFSTGPHLHFEIYQEGKLIDPADLLPELKDK